MHWYACNKKIIHVVLQYVINYTIHIYYMY